MLDEAQVKELIKSTTPKQKELMKSRGHLVPEDLNAKQRELLRSMGDIHGTMRLKVDDAEIIIKGPKGEMLHDEVIIAPRTGVPAPSVIPHVGELMPPPLAPSAEHGTPAPPPLGRWNELSASLTGSQKAQMKKQGFLYEDQLTAAQRRMVSLPQDASYTLTISNGRESITIKSRKQ
ncbi:MAG: hypothetical protein M3R13_05565 [Armatimonadota bacterium]|nr:hypothetical protein [Armatimonadota bacterium]